MTASETQKMEAQFIQKGGCINKSNPEDKGPVKDKRVAKLEVKIVLE